MAGFPQSRWSNREKARSHSIFSVLELEATHCLFHFLYHGWYRAGLSTVGGDHTGAWEERIIRRTSCSLTWVHLTSPADYPLQPPSPMSEISLHPSSHGSQQPHPIATASQSLDSCMPIKSTCRWSLNRQDAPHHIYTTQQWGRIAITTIYTAIQSTVSVGHAGITGS